MMAAKKFSPGSMSIPDDVMLQIIEHMTEQKASEALACISIISPKLMELFSYGAYLSSPTFPIRPLRKLASEEQALGSVHEVREDLSTGVTTQLPSEVEFPKRSIAGDAGDV